MRVPAHAATSQEALPPAPFLCLLLFKRQVQCENVHPGLTKQPKLSRRDVTLNHGAEGFFRHVAFASDTRNLI